MKAKYPESEYVGGSAGSESAKEDATTYAATITSISALDAALETFYPTTLNEFNPDNYYRIIFKRAGAMTNMIDTSTAYVEGTASAAYANSSGVVDANESRYVVTNSGAVDFATLWQFVSAGTDQYYLKNINSGLTLGSVESDALMLLAASTISSYAGVYSITQSTSTPIEHVLSDSKLSGDNIYLNCFYNTPNNYSKQIGAYGGGLTDGGNIVYLQEVTSIPVSITSAGYATLTSPVALTIPEGVTAYIVTGLSTTADNELALQQITGTIPANTPVILEGAEDSYDFTITTSSDSYTDTNKLFGTTMERHGLTAKGYYGLGVVNEVTAFYPVNSTEAPANKAYLYLSDLNTSSSANVLTFGFGDLTGIESVATEADPAKSNIYYDLEGRRVAYPSNGIFINANGQKVFIK